MLLLNRAVDQRHSWDGPTHAVLEELLGAFVVSGDDEAILTYALLPPLGVARPEEAERDQVVRFALGAASRLSREQLVYQIAESLGTSPRDDLERARVGLTNLTDEETVMLWKQVAVEADADREHELLLTAVMNQASNGVDDTSRLGPLVDRGIIPASAARLATLLVEAHEDLDSALPKLRALARTDVAAAEYVIALLVQDGRHDEAAVACRQAREIFKQDFFLFSEADVHLNANDFAKAEAVAVSAVACDGFPRERARLLTFLAGRAADRGEWGPAEDFLNRVLPLHAETRARDVWRLVLAQLNRGEGGRAAATVQKYAPDVRTPEEATLWLQAMQVVRWDQSIAATALSLASRFEDEEELSVALLGSLISSTTTAGAEASGDPDGPEDLAGAMDSRPVVDAELHKRAFAAFERIQVRNPSTDAVKVLQGSTEELLESITGLLRQNSERNGALRELAEKVQRGELPSGLLATGTRRSYALLLIQQAAGLLVAAAAHDDEHEADLSTAAEALNQNVVIDVSALLLSSQLDGGDILRGQFSELRIPTQARRDIVRATVEVRGLGASGGSLYWDEQMQQTVYSEFSAAEMLRLQTRADSLLAAAQGVTSHWVQGITLYPQLTDGQLDDVWLAPIQLAHDTGSALWSDDLGQRRLARYAGVSTFGTPALVEVLNQMQIDQVGLADHDRLQELIAERQLWVRQFIRESVVDVPAHLDDLISQARDDGWYPRAAATVLTRPSWWVWQSDPVSDWTHFIEIVGRENPDTVSAWQQAAMIGISRTYESREAGSAMLALVALLGLGHGISVTDSATGLVRARDVASKAGLPDPVASLAIAARGIAEAGRIEDPAQFTSAVLASLATDTHGTESTSGPI